MSFTVIVPVRLASTRLPNKPLIEIDNKPMVIHVLERVKKSGAKRVIVATEDQSIQDVVTTAGFEAKLTGECENGTQRVAKLADMLGITDVIVNVQGDEPTIEPDLVAKVAKQASTDEFDCVTAAAPITKTQALDPNTVKVVLRKDKQAILFSRNAIPHRASTSATKPTYLGHIGIYAFKADRLLETQQLPTCELEQAERLEQLRWLWHGWKIGVVTTKHYSSGIDTPDDLSNLKTKLATNKDG